MGLCTLKNALRQPYFREKLASVGNRDRTAVENRCRSWLQTDTFSHQPCFSALYLHFGSVYWSPKVSSTEWGDSSNVLSRTSSSSAVLLPGALWVSTRSGLQSTEEGKAWKGRHEGINCLQLGEKWSFQLADISRFIQGKAWKPVTALWNFSKFKIGETQRYWSKSLLFKIWSFACSSVTTSNFLKFCKHQLSFCKWV